ncbi:hypothetical protein N8804_01020 [Methylophilaceae bacterium]|nr:hypothetical protein [Methylophilaceae bacterium]
MRINKDFMVVGLGRLFIALLALLSIKFITIFLSPEQFGKLSILLALQSFCGLFIISPVGQYINRHTHQWWDTGSLFQQLKNYKVFVFLASCAGSFIVFIAFIEEPLEYKLLSSLVLIVMINASTWNSTFIPILNMTGFRVTAVILMGLSSLAGLVLSIALTSVFNIPEAWLFGQAAGLSIGAILAALYLRRYAWSSNRIERRFLTLDMYRKYCLPLAISAGCMWILAGGYRFIVDFYWGLTALGLLTMGLVLANQIWAVIEALAHQFLYPFFYKQIRLLEDDNNFILKASKPMSDLLNVMIPVYVLMIGMTLLLSPFLVQFLLDSSYKDAEYFFRYGIGIEFFRVLSNSLASASQITKQTKKIIKPYFIGAFFAIAMLIIFGYNRVDLIFVVIALFAVSILVTCLMWNSMRDEVYFYPAYNSWFISLMLSLVICFVGYFTNRYLSEELHVFISFLLILTVIVLFTIFCKKSNALKRLMSVKLNSMQDDLNDNF